MLRDHEIFHTPQSIDPARATRIETPAAWNDDTDAETVEVLPLVAEIGKSYDSGWCTYVFEHAQAPELEVLCGGVNSKTPRAGAIWRQGNLLHFGFEQTPRQMNETGRNLLVNSIAYIARFTDDRPIVRTPSVFFAGGKRIWDRGAIARLVNSPGRDLSLLKYYTSPALYEESQDRSREELGAWFRENEPWIHADESGKLALDEEARSFETGPATVEFLRRAVEALRDEGERAALARRLLDRYVPEGPADRDRAEDWAAWYAENRPYLFFSDTGGYRWYVDPLARARSVPTDELRGAARATREPLVPRSAAKR
ncbi:MAG TPA: hypothetical protein VML55_23690 [Planctomycetaceae bacterium]|nr:hypothetical protein [Planctomycetaceae bacterium]